MLDYQDERVGPLVDSHQRGPHERRPGVIERGMRARCDHVAQDGVAGRVGEVVQVDVVKRHVDSVGGNLRPARIVEFDAQPQRRVPPDRSSERRLECDLVERSG